MKVINKKAIVENMESEVGVGGWACLFGCIFGCGFGGGFTIAAGTLMYLI
ncbi:MAG: hypothetical protein KAQ68_11295 [Clostridiales bacterium]|nr:hypothetical protein [Clostridiales bacterium]